MSLPFSFIHKENVYIGPSVSYSRALNHSTTHYRSSPFCTLPTLKSGRPIASQNEIGPEGARMLLGRVAEGIVSGDQVDAVLSASDGLKTVRPLGVICKYFIDSPAIEIPRLPTAKVQVSSSQPLGRAVASSQPSESVINVGKSFSSDLPVPKNEDSSMLPSKAFNLPDQVIAPVSGVCRETAIGYI